MCTTKTLCNDTNCQKCFNASFMSNPDSEFWSNKNPLSPRQVFKKSNTKVLFDCCSCGHEFSKSPNMKSWCPYCANQKMCGDEKCNYCFEKSFASHKLSKYWSSENEIPPSQVFKMVTRKYIFNCNKCNHSFAQYLSNITKGVWCPYCANTKLCDDNDCQECFEKSFASNKESKYWSNKNEVRPRQLLKQSNKFFIFDCKCGHSFSKSLNMTSWCPYCANQKLCDMDNCQKCFEKSFASNSKSKYWSNKNELKPRQVFNQSGKKFMFDCKCGHEFEMTTSHITGGEWCSYCSNPPKKLCDADECQHCYDNSFESHNRSKYWSDKNDIKPRQVFKCAHKKFLFNCCYCGHEFLKDLSKMSGKTENTWCPYCSKPCHKLCEDEGCIHCLNNSFASHEKAQYWDNAKNDLNPRQVIRGSSNKYHFICENKHKFQIIMSSLTCNGNWCSKCRLKTEDKLMKWFDPKLKIEHQPNFGWCKNEETNRLLPFDFCCELLKLIIELDGGHHFRQISNWKSPEENTKRDIYKMEQANKNGYTIVRIIQEDVYSDKNDWEEKLRNAIKSYSTPTRIFICSDDEYSKHKISEKNN